MTSEKKIQVNSSSLVDLKAELFRKQEAVKAEKLKREFGYSPLNFAKKEKNTNAEAKHNDGVKDRAQRDVEEIIPQEEIDVLQKSRASLERKAKIYESLSQRKNFPDDETTELYLVDFQRKILNNKSNENESETDIKNDNEVSSSPPPSGPDEEWVDYTDSLGRSRRCLRKDLTGLLEMDKQLNKGKENDSEPSKSTEHQLLPNTIPGSFEDLPEIVTGPVHYQNVQHNEIRSHGVGYFAFSTEEEERKKQIENLNILRDQTLDQRTAREKMKEKRKAVLKARLDKVKQRKKIDSGDTEDLNSDDDDKDEPIKLENEVGEIPVPTDESVKIPTVRPWDKGKVLPPVQRNYKFTQKNWIEQRRTDRIQEFAPPTLYYDRTCNTTSAVEINQSSTQNYSNVNRNLQSDQIKMEDIPLPENNLQNIERVIAKTIAYFKNQSNFKK